MESETPTDVPWQVEAVREQLANCGPLTSNLLARRVGKRSLREAHGHISEWRFLRRSVDVPSDQIVKIKVPPRNVVYFLWSQRYDVYKRFGVGPTLTNMENLNVN
jgi:hypothetical protein